MSVLQRPGAVAVVPALLAALAWAAWFPHTADLAAQVYRTGLAARFGFTVWDNDWFGGHLLPGYSLIVPTLGALVGLRTLGVVAAGLFTWCAASIVQHADSEAGPGPARWLACAAVADLAIGRITYLVGAAAGAAAVLLLQRHPRPSLLAAVGSLTAAASPIAGLFLVLVAVASWGRRPAAAVLAAGVAPAVVVGVMSVVFGDGGSQPYSLAAAAIAAAAGLAVWRVAEDAWPVVRRAALLYVVAVVAAYVLPTPMGSNVSRLGVSCAAPVLLLCTRGQRRRWHITATVAAGIWLLAGPLTEIDKATDIPTPTQQAFAPLLQQLEHRGATRGRVEVVPSATRWESVWVARRFALARGWETQLDRARNPLFYDGRLTASGYERWLRATAVRFVAVSTAPKERWGQREAALVARGIPSLRSVWAGKGWRLYEVRGSAAVAPKLLTVAQTSQEVVLRARRRVRSSTLLHWTRWWSVRGPACVRPTRDGGTEIDVSAPGVIVLRARLSATAGLRRARCRAVGSIRSTSQVPGRGVRAVR